MVPYNCKEEIYIIFSITNSFTFSISIIYRCLFVDEPTGFQAQLLQSASRFLCRSGAGPVEYIPRGQQLDIRSVGRSGILTESLVRTTCFLVVDERSQQVIELGVHAEYLWEEST